ncbi:MAG: translation initiation factor IF-2 [Candidatus Mcinerneyibacterium aminivorans]|uniref:Translation initiation factor IF-2 n=1 Tax=Candidatus Mcinerneyibacterium aminivorans TaxID=2703815 RepID=A0A5D0MKL1_9BACT|nr:MAG: translation initiation factor IF-2 [Candidatus Mcinerneyibacterium aminivorans]
MKGDKIRIHELAKEIGVSSSKVIEFFQKEGLDEISSHMNVVGPYEARIAKEHFGVQEKSEEENKPVARIRRRVRKKSTKKKKDEKEQTEKKEKEDKKTTKKKKEKKEKKKKDKVAKKEKQQKKEKVEEKTETKEEEKETKKEAKKEKKKKEKVAYQEEDEQFEKFEKDREEKGKKKKKKPKPQKEKGWKEDYAWIREQIEGEKKEKLKEKKKELEQKKKEKEQQRKVSWEEIMQNKAPNKPKKKKKKPKDTKNKKEKKERLYLMKGLTYEDFAENLGLSTEKLVELLKKDGIEVEDVQNSIEEDYAKIMADEFGKELVIIQNYGDDIILEQFKKHEDKTKKPRPPVVTVMGHVDHGKTSILDYIRKSKVANSEHGGITQHIGAYSVKAEKGEISFIDTPGHEAFTEMRTRGANITDIVILVVAADDGVMPQTEEAISHAQNAGVPIVIALNKMDLPSANPQKVKQELTKFEIVPEEWGGDHLFVECSAETGEGIDELLDMILLQAEMMELKAIKDAPARGVVVESEKKKGKGVVATVLIRRGTLKVGDSFVVGNSYGRVRFITDDKGKRVKMIEPGKAGEITGLEELPTAGDKLAVIDEEKTARKIAEKRKYYEKRREIKEDREAVSLEDLFAQMEGEKVELTLIVKGDTNGTLEAVENSIDNLSYKEVDINIVHTGVGMVTENDINLAITTNSIVIAFNVRVDSSARKLADQENIEVREYNVIYKLLEDIEKAAAGLLQPEEVEVYIGSAEIRQIIKVPDIGNIAGSYVKDGKIKRNGIAKLVRDGKHIWEGKIDSLKRFKDDVKEVSEGYECGIGLENYNDIKEGDIVEVYQIEERERALE